jgi:phenylacetate-CoA ligase
MNRFYDDLETRDPEAREAAWMAALPLAVARAQATAAGTTLLAGIDAATVSSRAVLMTLPVTRKSELLARQQAARAAGGDPFGGFAAIGWRALGLQAARRVFQSPGPIYEPEGAPPTTGASAAPCSPPAFAPATWCTTASAIT